MSNEYFQFKQFTVHHERCGMKIGTDGVLLGAWAPVDGVGSVLDVGTGSGLIALQLAQRCPSATITAIEIESEAAAQAQENMEESPWGNRMEVVCQDFTSFTTHQRFDLIVSNPPYFQDSLRNPDLQRSMARHTTTLPFQTLFRQSASLLADGGRMAVVVPADAARQVEETAWFSGLYLQRTTRVYTKPGKPCKRQLILFGNRFTALPLSDELFIHDATGGYSEEYRLLTSPFYLHC